MTSVGDTPGGECVVPTPAAIACASASAFPAPAAAPSPAFVASCGSEPAMGMLPMGPNPVILVSSSKRILTTARIIPRWFPPETLCIGEIPFSSTNASKIMGSKWTLARPRGVMQVRRIKRLWESGAILFPNVFQGFLGDCPTICHNMLML